VSLKRHAPEKGNFHSTDRNAAWPALALGWFCTQRVFRAVVGSSPGPLPDPNATPQRPHDCRLLAQGVGSPRRSDTSGVEGEADMPRQLDRRV
jgi:hypothetical protein